MRSILWATMLGVLALYTPVATIAQSTNASLNEDYYHWLDRYEIKGGRVSSELFTTIKPYKRSAIAAYLDTLAAKNQVFTSNADKFNLEYLRNDNWEWTRPATNDSERPIWKKLYRKKSDMAHVDIPDFDLHVSPVLYAAFGNDSERSGLSYINTRGVEIRGMIDKKVGFYTFLGENQSVLPYYVQRGMATNPVVPHEGFWKPFKTNAVDFFQARAYIDFNVSKHVYLQLGHDRMFIGNGVRSLIYSDNAPPQLYFRANAKVWKLNYLFQINRMVGDVTGNATGGLSGGSGGKYPEKYVAFHHASFNIGKKFNFGLFESIIYSPQDSVAGRKSSFEWNYMNPVIFYRAIEQQFGSADNAIVGADAKWNPGKGISVYGQLVLDEFLLSHVRARDGWWANKSAAQIGIKYIDAFGVNNLDLQVEGNAVRPYTYSHNTRLSNYTNYRQAIAHPVGANFRELIGVVRYQPLGKLNVVAKLYYIKGGSDYQTGKNYGSDPFKNSETRVKELGNKIGQGTGDTRVFATLTMSYMLKHNLFVDLQYVQRKQTYTFDPSVQVVAGTYAGSTASLASLAVRWNVARRTYEF